MNTPETKTRQTAGVETPAAVSVCPAKPPLTMLQKRADFLRAARAKRAVTPAFILQMRHRAPENGVGPDNGIRVGFTCSKKVGNAVARNRAKRRLREISRLEIAEHGVAGCDYVLIGRARVTARRDFAEMRRDLRHALGKLRGIK